MVDTLDDVGSNPPYIEPKSGVDLSFDLSFRVGGGELFEKLSEEELISEGEAVFFIKQILHGVKSMHKNGILHLDLKVIASSSVQFGFIFKIQ